MQHTCQDCDHKFLDAGQSQDSISPAVQCPNCHSYRTQPAGIPDEQNDMVHGIGAMPNENQAEDMSGNPLKEGILADGGWKNRQVRDESFASVRSKVSLFETPEFETTQIVAPPDLYRHAMETEAAHRAGIQIPKGITDNLHATLGNLGAWVENPYENGELRPYYKSYWKAIRPQFSKPGALQIGVADPLMAEIINHVAQTDDITPLYQYRGKQSSTKTAGPALALLPEGAAALLGGGAADAAGAAAADAGGAAAAGGAADAAGGAAAAGTAGANEAASGAGGVGGLMQKVMSPVQGVLDAPGIKQVRGIGQLGTGLNYADDLLGMGANGPGGAGGGGVPMSPHDVSFYARTATDEDDAYPDSHDEIPKHEDGDYHQQEDGNQHEWQRDLSVNEDGGDSLHSPSFDAGGPAFQRFMMLAPLLLQMLQNGEDGSQDPLVQGLHHSLESEIPGYQDHADDGAMQRLIMVLSPEEQKSEPKDGETNESDHTDENAGGAHESKVAHIDGDVAEFLPDFTITPPALNGARLASPILYEEIAALRHGLPADVQREIDDILIHDGPEVAVQYLQQNVRPAPVPSSLNTDNTPLQSMARTADTQGPHTPEQIQAVQQWLLDHGQELGLQGDELTQTILSVPTNPMEFADVLAQIQRSEPPPPGPEDAGMSSGPPMPAQEAAPPGATMPVPGMEQMMSAVRRYAADSVAGVCPNCGGHTTELLDEDGTSHCHGCDATFKTEGKQPNKIDSTASTWNVDEDLRKEADADQGSDFGSSTDAAPVQGVPIADQQHQRDLREEQDSGHTWTDEDGNPLKVGQEYEMYSSKYDIPDLVRIEAVKPDSIVYTLTGEFGLEHSTELTREEANIERLSFRSTTQDDGEIDSGLEANNDDNSAYMGEPERTDASAPAGLVAASVITSGVDRENPALSWLKDGLSRTAGANYTPMEQRALIDEMGNARNADMLDLSGTHYLQDADEDQFLFGY